MRAKKDEKDKTAKSGILAGATQSPASSSGTTNIERNPSPDDRKADEVKRAKVEQKVEDPRTKAEKREGTDGVAPDAKLFKQTFAQGEDKKRSIETLQAALEVEE